MSGAMALDPAVLDSLLALAEGDMTFVDDLLQTYITQGDDLLDAMRLALLESDDAALRRGAHALAGASLNVGAAPTAALCRLIEEAAMRGERATMAADLRKLDAELARMRRAVNERTTANLMLQAG